MPVVRKTFGEYPMKTVVNTTEVHFDENGLAEVEQDIFDALLTVPGFESGEEAEQIIDTFEEESTSEDESEDEEEAPTPLKPARKRPAPKK